MYTYKYIGIDKIINENRYHI